METTEKSLKKRKISLYKKYTCHKTGRKKYWISVLDTIQYGFHITRPCHIKSIERKPFVNRDLKKEKEKCIKIR